MRATREPLLKALRQHNAAESEAEIELAVLALHQGMQAALLAYLESQGDTQVDPQVSFPKLVDLVRELTDLFGDDAQVVPLLVSLNTTRNQIAHPTAGDKPSPSQIANDARQLARLIRRFWPDWYEERCPVSSASQPRPTDRSVEPDRPTESVQSARTSRGPGRLRSFLRRMWKDESQPGWKLGRLVVRLLGVGLFWFLAQVCRDAALNTARWPVPIKYASLVLLLLALGLWVWSLVLVWRVLRQLRLKRLLMVLGVLCLAILSVSVLTSDSDLPFHRETWSTIRRSVAFAGSRLRDGALSLARTPQEFRLAYTGRRRLARLPGMDPDDDSYRTPIPANLAARSAQPGAGTTTATPGTSSTVPASTGTLVLTPVSGSVTPAPTVASIPTAAPASMLLAPDCPHPQARLTAPRQNEVIADEVQVLGSANIESLGYYKFEYMRVDVEDEWHWTAEGKVPVVDGVLGTWQVSHLPEGTYLFRLTVVNKQGNYPFPPCDVRVQIKR